ncbi:MAG: hypothetical protein OEV99_03625 [Nitrospira sp.]|nr:hypothetical protein [Nitrospira sp.]MDH4368910.1 hypothetical protein [Nitrospira sp.]MDH5347336.1 hypothetical protein [Nitrospira sp.]MDH5496765.1 hypothetical protein [Nitrospira sp.]MDH5724516.1 hypothetical protein [Nitrospira sp.]
MGHFTTKGKLFREGTDLSSFGSLDVTVTAAGTTVEQTAPPSLPDANGVSRSFLYWDTGRRITGKRKIRWTFNHPTNWSEWPAAAYYGIPPTGPGTTARVIVDAHWVSTGPINPTPIDGPGSTFVNAPGGTPVAWPGDGNDHVVRTQWGAATIHAKDHLQRSIGDPLLDFSSWQQLVYGGDATGYFEENDDDIVSGVGVTGIANSTSPFFSVPQNNSSFLMAAYVVPAKPGIDIFVKLIELIRAHDLGKFIDKGDPSPEDIIRLKLISESLDVVRGGTVTDFDAFEGLLGAAKKMQSAELRRTIAGTRATLLRGQAVLKTLEAMAKKTTPRK